MYKFKFADIGEGLHEGTVGEIYVKVNTKVNEGDSLFSVETDKVTSDIPCPVTGEIKDILIKTGDTIHVGDEIFYIDDGSQDNEGVVSETPQEPPKEAASEEAASVVGSIKVSNEMFSFDSFNNNQDEVKPAVKTDEEIVNSNQKKMNLPDPSQINPTGNGEEVDVVVLGAGPGGYDITARLAHEGLKTVCIEDQFAGGVCLNIGCIPTKALLKGAKVHSYIKHAHELGLDLDVKKVKVNWEKMQARKVSISKTLEKAVEFKIKAAKAEFVKGYGEIIDKHNIKVGNKVFTTKYIIIATGSHPISLNKLPGFEKGYKDGTVIDSTGALNLKKLPQKMAIVGGGVIGVEFATLFNELGVDVTILEGSSEILGIMDHDVRKFTLEHLVSQGIKIKTNVKVSKLDNLNVIFENEGKEESIKIDKLLVSVGRVPNHMNLDKKLGINLGQRHEIIVNDIMQTNISNIFAIGDVVGHAMLAHTAYRHAAVLHKAFRGIYKPYNKNTIPGCVYIYPEISAIGKTEDELKKEGTEYEVSLWHNQNIGRALAESDTKGFTKIIYEKEYGLILGAHIINAASSEIITEIGAVMEMEGTIFELADTTHPHPALAEGIYEAVVQAEEKLNKK